MISTCCPGCTSAPSRTACSAVSADTDTAAACSKVRFVGFGASLSARAAAYSAKQPSPMPKTSSPTSSVVTSVPSAMTVPATSRPLTLVLGARMAFPASRTGYGRPANRCQTPRSTPAA